jgi:hypothetical protein
VVEPRGIEPLATAAARFVSTLFTFACKRYPALRTLGDPCSAVSTVDPEREDLPALAEPDMKEWAYATAATNGGPRRLAHDAQRARELG